MSSSGRWLWFRVNPRVSRRHWRVFTIWRGPKPRQHSQPLPRMRCVLICCLCHRFVCILENMGLPTKVALTSSIQRFSRSSVDPVQIWLQYAVIGNGFARLMMELGQEGNIVGAVESSVIRDPGRDAKIWYLTQIWLHVDIEFLYPLLLSAYVFIYVFLWFQTLKVSFTLTLHQLESCRLLSCLAVRCGEVERRHGGEVDLRLLVGAP